MNSIDERVINVLTGLTEICRDGRHSFETAAEQAEAGGVRPLFQSYAVERQQYVRELQAQISALGGNPEKSGSVAGSLHRGWINLKAAMTANDLASVLSESERGEDAAVSAYEDALQVELDPDTRTIVSRQLRGVKAACERVKQLREWLVPVLPEDEDRGTKDLCPRP
jgi:uncharacterized protein (TIGR02284 family)